MTAEEQKEKRIILAADELTQEQCAALVYKLRGRLYAVKLHNLVDRQGPNIIEMVRFYGADRVWMDAKLHDIPNTVGLRAKAYRDAGADILTVHASGGIKMMESAVKMGPSLIYAITILTSIDDEEVQRIYRASPAEAALTLALSAKQAGVHGIVCSPKEVEFLSQEPGLKGVELVVPGTRSPGKAAGDQKRVAEPGITVRKGAKRLVAGRQLTDAEDPAAELDAIEAEIAAALAA